MSSRLDNKREISPTYYRPGGLDGIELLSCYSNRHFSSHLHSGYNIWLNSTGGEVFHFKGSSSILSPASFGIVAPGEIHANHPLEDGERHLRSFYVEDALMKSIARQAGKKCAFTGTIFEDRELHGKLLELHRVLTESPMLLARQSCLIDLLSRVVLRHAEGYGKGAEGEVGGRRILHIKAFLAENLAEDISVESLAEIAGCSPYHLIRSFKKATGFPPHAFLIQLRLERAKTLLKKKTPISQAALEAGFADQSHLSRLFKRTFGITPLTYVRQVAR